MFSRLNLFQSLTICRWKLLLFFPYVERDVCLLNSYRKSVFSIQHRFEIIRSLQSTVNMRMMRKVTECKYFNWREGIYYASIGLPKRPALNLQFLPQVYHQLPLNSKLYWMLMFVCYCRVQCCVHRIWIENVSTVTNNTFSALLIERSNIFVCSTCLLVLSSNIIVVHNT